MMSSGDEATPVSERYEFTEDQNTLIGDLSKKMGLVGAVLIALGLVAILFGIIALFRLPPAAGIAQIIQGLIYLFLGYWTYQASGSFRTIVETAGRDVAHLIEALSNLRKMYTLMYWIIIVGLILLVIAFVVNLVFGPGEAVR